LAIVEFCWKYEYMLRGNQESTVFTDHLPITFFLKCSLVEGIYARWACELRNLNIRIEYIPGPKNKAADALSRTIFPDDDCEYDFAEYSEMGENENGEPQWIWKDGKGEYEELLKGMANLHHNKLKALMRTEEGKTLVAGPSTADAKFVTALLTCMNVTNKGTPKSNLGEISKYERSS
jgi:hypothetical protein